MSTVVFQPDARDQGLLQEIIGYLNFSSGASDPAFLRNLNALVCGLESRNGSSGDSVAVLCDWLNRRMDELQKESSTFGDVSQARAVVGLLGGQLLPAYRKFHRDLLWHQSERELWRPLFLGRAIEALLTQGGPWD
ncbi:MAG TPA: hypothetical protein VGM76_18495, partial [Lacipirellulaceae bacterium]